MFSARSCNICILIAHKQSAPGAPRLGSDSNGTISPQMSSLYSEARGPEIIHVSMVAGKSSVPNQVVSQHNEHRLSFFMICGFTLLVSL